MENAIILTTSARPLRQDWWALHNVHISNRARSSRLSAPTARHAVRRPARLQRGRRIVFDGKDITDWQTAKITHEAVAIVPEGRRVFSRMTVEENPGDGRVFCRPRSVQTRIKWVYELFRESPHERRIQRIGTMSGGEQQMLAIGRA